MSVRSYRVVLPEPWRRIPTGPGRSERIAEMVAEAATRLPRDVPPDQAGPWRRELERRMTADVQAAADNGAVDVYLPSDTWHGFLIGASFIVSLVAPPGLVPDGATGEEAAALLITELAAGEGADLMSIDGTPWVRVESVEEADPARADIDVGTRRVEYLTPHPDIPQRWIIVAFSCTGAGDPTDEVADVTVRLFDAIMGTWRWIERGDPFDGPGNPLL